MSPIQGFTRLRAVQLGKQSVIGTAVPAGRRLPLAGAPDVNLNWTDPDVDVGSLDPVLPPYRLGEDITAPWSGPLDYDSAPVYYSAGVKGGVTAGGGVGGRTWSFHPSSTSSDPFDYYTGEWGDEVAADQWQYFGGIIEVITLTYPQDLGPVTIDTQWRFAGHNWPVARTTGLSVDPNAVWVNHADTEYFVDSTSGAIGTAKLTDSVHDMTVVITNTIDVKRFPNGSNTRYQVSGYGRGPRTVVATLNFAKQTATLLEVANWLAADSVNRFLEARTTSVKHIGAGTTPYSHSLKWGGRWYTRADGEVNNNTAFQLESHAYFDSGLGYPFGIDVVNALATLP